MRMERVRVDECRSGTVAMFGQFWGVVGAWNGAGGREFHPWDADSIRLNRYDVLRIPYSQRAKLRRVSGE